jgi:hypothetical protein
MRSVNNNLTPAQLVARLQSSAIAFPAAAAGETTMPPTCPMNDAQSGECVCPNAGAGSGNQCGAGMVNALQAVKAAQKPIGVILIPEILAAGSVFDAGGSVAGCNTSLSTPAPLGIASYAWTAAPSSLIASGADTAKVSVNPAPGTLTLTVTDSAGNTDVETVLLTADSAASAAPSKTGTSATACPAALRVSPMAPRVSESFSPASVAENTVSTLTITFANSNAFTLTQTKFSLTLPSNLSIAAMPATTCGGAGQSLTSTTTSVSLNDANIPADGNCIITVPVQGASAGSFTASIAAQALSTAPAGANAASATASLTVSAPSSGGGGGALDWLDILFVAGVLLALRGQALRRMSRKSFDAGAQKGRQRR